MPSETYNRVEELIDQAGYPDDQVDEADLQATLERAHNSIQSDVGRHFIEDYRLKRETESGDLVNELDLKFGPILEVDEILINNHEVLTDTNYTVDKQNGVITIDSNFAEDELSIGQILRIKYTPIQFKDVELYKAVSLEKNQEIVNLEDSEQTALYRNAEALYRQEVNSVNRMAGPGKARDGRVRRGTK